MWEEKLKLYDSLIAGHPIIVRKGKTVPYTSANGYMFSMVNKEGEIGIRLPKDSQKKFLEKYDSGPLKSHGATMRGYVLIPDDILADKKRFVSLLNESYQYVMSLDPK